MSEFWILMTGVGVGCFFGYIIGAFLAMGKLEDQEMDRLHTERVRDDDKPIK